MKFITRYIFILCIYHSAWCQVPIEGNYVDIMIQNDDAGIISDVLNTGDDLGQTHKTSLSLHLQNRLKKFNVRCKLESTEYSTLTDKNSIEKNIYFTEINHLAITFDNNQFTHKTLYLSISGGLMYIQGNSITPGATGQKRLTHDLIISKFYPKNKWEYVSSDTKEHLIPYVEPKIGYSTYLTKKTKTLLLSSTSIQAGVASNIHFSGIGMNSNLLFRYTPTKGWIKSIDIDIEGGVKSNMIYYSQSYLQSGYRIHWKTISWYFQIWKPFTKYLSNPYIIYDDLEPQFNFGLLIRIGKKRLLHT